MLTYDFHSCDLILVLVTEYKPARVRFILLRSVAENIRGLITLQRNITRDNNFAEEYLEKVNSLLPE